MILINNRQGQQLAVYRFGQPSQPSIVFSNSLGTDYAMWQSQIEFFSQNYDVICYDTRGHGKSQVVAASSLQDLANDVVDILEHLKVEKAHFCGISMGGITGLQLGINAPERFLSLTIANSAAKIGQENAWLSRADSVEAEGLADIVSTTHSRWFSDKFDYAHDHVAQKTIQSLSLTPAQGYAAACRALAYADLREQISGIQVPCLALCGALDPITTIIDGTLLQEHITGCELAVLDASHLSNIEQAEQFNQVLAAFIAKR